jgi:hypothetical protein
VLQNEDNPRLQVLINDLETLISQSLLVLKRQIRDRIMYFRYCVA